MSDLSSFLRTVALLLGSAAVISQAGMLHIHPVIPTMYDAASADARSADSEEIQFQSYLDSLFDTHGKTIDTSGWCTYKINCARFDYRLLVDSVRIPLIDSALGRHFTYPLKNYVTSPFGPRQQYWHFGTDIKVVYHDTIRSTFDGIVRVVTNDKYGYGKVAVVRHHYGLETLYGHMSKIFVKSNQVLKSGDPIGLGGRTGRATGAHLHFEIRFCGEPFDPALLLDYDNFCLRSDTLVVTQNTFEYVSDLRKTIFHTVHQGDNLGKIANSYHTSISKICRYNGITRSTLLKIGRRLIVRKDESPELISNTSPEVSGGGGDS